MMWSFQVINQLQYGNDHWKTCSELKFALKIYIYEQEFWLQALSAHLYSSTLFVSILLLSWFWDPPARIHSITLVGQVGSGARISLCRSLRLFLSEKISLQDVSQQVTLTLNSRKTLQKNKPRLSPVDSDMVTSCWGVTCQTNVVSPDTCDWEFSFPVWCWAFHY